ncbi:MAG: glycosyltransferase [Gemmatimonadetes bacterium]|nr:glycosyltransferase [Gemmatimonadota bacterium]
MNAEIELSVVIPVYNEEEVLPECHKRVKAALEALELAYEIVFVNDGSSDSSVEILRAFAERDRFVRVVLLSRNFGHQIAITAGLDHARGAAVVVMDADLQDPPEVLGEMVARWRTGFDVVYGVRAQREGESAFKTASASIFYRLIRALAAVDIPLDAGDFRLMSRRAVDALRQIEERHRFVRGLVTWIGFRQTGIDYVREPRGAGVTKYPLRKMLIFAFDAIVSFSSAPLRVATALGLFSSLAAFGYGAYAVSAKLFNDRVVSGWTSTVIVVAFLGGVQLLSLGIIGEYLGRIYNEAKARPLYFVDEVLQ